MEQPAAGALDARAAIVDALLAYASSQSGAGALLAIEPDARAFVLSDPFAFLVGVIFNQSIRAERAWRAPFELRRRLGHLDPGRIVADPGAVETAVAGPPALHRFVRAISGWTVAAAARVLSRYDGDAGAVWAGAPTAAELQERLERFSGIGQKKAAMAVAMLPRYLHVAIRRMDGNDVALDRHVRRVFLRTGLVEHDERGEILAAARALDPGQPSEIDFPACLVGRRWCRPVPRCAACVLTPLCPKLIERAPPGADVH
jgi:uncharacterized HhH-GPD family protein